MAGIYFAFANLSLVIANVNKIFVLLLIAKKAKKAKFYRQKSFLCAILKKFAKTKKNSMEPVSNMHCKKMFTTQETEKRKEKDESYKNGMPELPRRTHDSGRNEGRFRDLCLLQDKGLYRAE